MKHTSKSVGSVAADGEGTQAGSQVAEMTAQTSAAPPNPPPPPLELLPIRRRHCRLPLLSLPVCAGAAADAPRRAVRWLFVTSRTPRVQAAPCSGPTHAWPRRRRSQTRFGPRCEGRTVCDAEPNDAEPMGPSCLRMRSRAVCDVESIRPRPLLLPSDGTGFHAAAIALGVAPAARCSHRPHTSFLPHDASLAPSMPRSEFGGRHLHPL